MTDQPPHAAKPRRKQSERRQAVILIHGIGEQRPMETLRGFVDAVLAHEPGGPRYYSKPDLLSDNFELRRLVTTTARHGRTDFFEFYWAHMMPTAAWDRLASWYWMLMHRRPAEVPKPLRPVWALSWGVLVAVALFGLVTSIRFLLGYPVADNPLSKAPWFLLAVLGAGSALLRSYIGDAAVYLSPTPRNIEARQAIRAAGLRLLDKVAGSGRYDRIVVVGHSLGSVIGCDVLTLAWQRHVDDVRARLTAAWGAGGLPSLETTALSAAEHAAVALQVGPPQPSPAPFAAWRQCQYQLGAELRANASTLVSTERQVGLMPRAGHWLVTDFVTLGSPLTFGDLLLASCRDDFERRIEQRELPCCPPIPDEPRQAGAVTSANAAKLAVKFSFEHHGRDTLQRPQHACLPHHAALFGPTAWTNLYFPCRHLLFGDVVGGPVAPLFGPGICDVPVETRIWGGWLAHTHYWTGGPGYPDGTASPVRELGEALDLGRGRAPGEPPVPPPAPPRPPAPPTP